MTRSDATAEPGGAEEISAAHDAYLAAARERLAPRALDESAVLRPARPGDEAGILACIRALAEYEREPDAVHNTVDALAGTLFGPDPKVFAHVVERGGEIVGIAIWFLTYSTWTGRPGIWLEDLFVFDEQRGRGYGRALIASLARVCVDRGYSRLEWTVLDWNGPAIGFYRSLHAQPMSEWTTQRLTDDGLLALSREI
jgi:GNAT superfamily N-acetyltransferase